MKDFDYAQRSVTIGKTTYVVRELSLEEFEQVNEMRKSGDPNAGVNASLEMVKIGLVDPVIEPDRLRKIGLSTLMKLGAEILAASGVGKDEKKETETED